MSEAGLGRRDSDFVAMSDYQSDMRETADQAAHIIRTLTEERDFWRSSFWEAVAKAGPIRIPLSDGGFHVFHLRQLAPGQTIDYYAYDDTYQFAYRRRKREEGKWGQ